MTAAALLCLLGLLAVPAHGQAPVRVEEFVYSIIAFNGKDYSGTFARQGAEDIYLIADVDNFVTVSKAFVYFWPITQEWKIDTSVLNQPLEGRLEIEGPGMPRTELALARFTYYNTRGEYELAWTAAKGEEAERVYARYRLQRDAYWKARDAYAAAQLAHEKRVNELANRILELRRRGVDPKALVEELNSLKPPEEPKPSDEFVVPPREPQEAYALNLPAGEYRIRFVAPDGRIVEGSERRLVVFRKRRGGTAGYDVIPADKWTRPEESNQPASVLYVNGRTDIYLRPFYQDEFVDLEYEKLIRNDARGNPNLTKWVKMQQIPKAVIEVLRPDGSMEHVTEKPYRVEQLPGSALGYRIEPFEPSPERSEADLHAYRIAIDPQQSVLRLLVRDSRGAPVEGGEREIRVVPGPRGEAGLWLLSLCPILALAVVLACRWAGLRS